MRIFNIEIRKINRFRQKIIDDYANFKGITVFGKKIHYKDIIIGIIWSVIVVVFVTFTAIGIFLFGRKKGDKQ